MTAKLIKVTPDEYHALPPAFSQSLATTLIAKSPLHARTQQLDGSGKAPTDSMDLGNVVHSLVLGTGKKYAVLEYNDFRTKAAKEARDAARARGQVPILRDDFEEARQIAIRIHEQLDARGIVLNGDSEVAIEWDEETPFGTVTCRGMMDHLWLRHGRILDLKVTADASPLKVERSAESFGYAIQCAAYTRALGKYDPSLAGRTTFLFVFAETSPPYAVNVCKPDGVFRELGDRRWTRAVMTWANCMLENKWPGYGSGVNDLTAPPWAMQREELGL